jgi:DNA repair protein RecO (recombination protein O)
MSKCIGQPVDVPGDVHSTKALVLRRVDYKDSDRILTLFTRDHGKISALARGARSSVKRFSGSSEPFVLMDVVLENSAGRSMRHLVESSTVEAIVGLSKSSGRLSAASFAVELFRESVPDETPDARLFDLLHNSLRLLGRLDGTPLRTAVLGFQLKLLILLGIGPGIEGCNRCGTKVPPGRSAFFHPGGGGVICTACGGGPFLLSSEALSAMNLMSGADFQALNEQELSREAERQIDTAMISFMEQHLGKPLFTRAFYEASVSDPDLKGPSRSDNGPTRSHS